MIPSIPVDPSGQPGMTGGGVYRRNLLGMASGRVTRCNDRGTFFDKSRRISRMQPVNFGDKGDFFRGTGLDPEIDEWSDLPEPDKARLRQTLQVQMASAAKLILSQLGL